jgi:hypothetical protein
MYTLYKILDNSVVVAIGYGVHFPAGAKFFSLYSFHTDFGAHPASYPTGTGGSFLEGKAAGA